jgi:hypothetical protein
MIIDDSVRKRLELIERLNNWWFTQSRDPAGPTNLELYDRVGKVLDQDRKDGERLVATGQVQYRDSNDLLVALWSRVRGAIVTTIEVTSATTQPSSVKKKPGRKSNPTRDKKIAQEYHSGLVEGLWESQAAYIRKKHPGKSGAWLSKLLSRVN